MKLLTKFQEKKIGFRCLIMLQKRVLFETTKDQINLELLRQLDKYNSTLKFSCFDNYKVRSTLY